MTLSPSQSAILACLKRRRDQWGFPKPLVRIGSVAYYDWSYSWEIVQNCKTADYRRRIYELRQKGYKIEKFSKSEFLPNDKIVIRHGYILVAEPVKESEAA